MFKKEILQIFDSSNIFINKWKFQQILILILKK